MKLDIDTKIYEFSSMTDLTENQPLRVCFVCTGNTCRSPMAAAVLNKLGNRYNIRAASAGLYPRVGDPISVNAEETLIRHGFEVPDHSARRIGEEIVNEHDRIVGISENHTFILMQMFPAAISKIVSMPCDIRDPYGRSPEEYEECLLQIIDGIKEMFKLYD